MYTRNKPNEAYIGRQLWNEASSPGIGILRQLANKLLSEVENIDESKQVRFGDGFKLSDQVQKFEMDMIRHALYLANGKQSEAARRLGIKVTTLNEKIKRYQIDPKLPYLSEKGRKQ